MWRTLSAAIRRQGEIVLNVASSGIASLLLPGAFDRSLRDIMRFSNPQSMEQPFGGKVVVFGGDFRQILPVIPKGSREDIVFSAINSSNLWDFCSVLSLTRNIRLEVGSSNSNLQDIKEFSEWILRIGDGKEGESNDGEATIQILDDVLIKDVVISPISSIVDSVYPFIYNLYK
uniref:ATP-dependent DNA helicase n=1 Tax=Chenopodium quinoa TaxID=63459 RepID=A0A803LT15_CHEQI